MAGRDDDAAPFSRIGIVGTGLIGGSIALAARRAWPQVHVMGTASRRGPLPAGLLDVTVDDVGLMAATCDLIVLAVPVAAMPQAMATLVRLGSNAVVTDVGSTKRGVMAAAASAALPSFVGGHPMAGAERPGAAEARADLFVAKPWLLVQGAAAPAEAARFEAFVRALGAVPRWIDAESHDRAVAFVSHLPQVLATVLMNAAESAVPDDGPRAAGNAFAEMTRLASSPADLWQGICAENADFVADALRRFVELLPTATDLKDGTWVASALDQSGAARDRWRALRNRVDQAP